MEIKTKLMYHFVPQVAIGSMRIITGDRNTMKRGTKCYKNPTLSLILMLLLKMG